jgi:DNA-binding FadR family transcriptional regulator
LGDEVARQIEGDIIAQGWPVGVVLGSEADLVKRYGVSRAIFREAVRLVEHHQIAVMRRGPGGGLVVTAPDAGSIARSMALNLTYQNAGAADLVEARIPVEVAAAQLAADRITDEGIAQLREARDRERHLQRDLHLPGSHGIHQTIAELSGNAPLRMFVEVLVRLTDELLPGSRNGDATQAVAHVHDCIVDAVIAGDSAVAAHHMRSHLRAMGEWLKESTSSSHRVS